MLRVNRGLECLGKEAYWYCKIHHHVELVSRWRCLILYGSVVPRHDPCDFNPKRLLGWPLKKGGCLWQFS